jgi:hypothetical protein
MPTIRVEFGMPFQGQAVSHDWIWGDVGDFNPNVNYHKLAKMIVQNLPVDGPSNVWIKTGGRLLAVWSRYSERCSQLGISRCQHPARRMGGAQRYPSRR